MRAKTFVVGALALAAVSWTVAACSFGPSKYKGPFPPTADAAAVTPDAAPSTDSAAPATDSAAPSADSAGDVAAPALDGATSDRGAADALPDANGDSSAGG